MHFSSARSPLLLCLCVGLLASVPAQSHQTTSTSWCSVNNAQIEIVGSFSYTATELSEYSANRVPLNLLTWEPCDDALDPDGCGIVDNWHWANQRAAAYCRSLVATDQRNTLQPIPVIDGPITFFGDKHHKYKFEDGLNGVCAVCISGSESGQ
jgi:hypothetical protein